MKLRRSFVGLAMAACLVAAGASPAFAGFPGRNGRITFIGGGYDVDENDVAAIFSFDPLSGDVDSIPRHASWPSWSPDGTRLAYVTGFSPGIIRIDGVRLTRGYDPAWSPDGDQIVFHSWPRNGDAELWLINVDGSGLTQLTRNGTNDWMPNWGTSGEIAFIRRGEVFTLDPNGGSATRLTSGMRYAAFPNWSPDGTRLAFARGGNILKLNVETHKSRRIRGKRLHLSQPVWSPNGKKIVCSVGIEESKLLIMRTDGTRKRFPNPDIGIEMDEFHTEPDWQPLPPTEE